MTYQHGIPHIPKLHCTLPQTAENTVR